MRSVARTTDWLATASTALDRGAKQDSPASLAWDIAGRCENPVYREFVGRTQHSKELWKQIQKVSTDRQTLEMWTRCRKCNPCLKARSYLWRIKAVSEVLQAERTWFVTLTLNPAEQARALLMACHRLAGQGRDWDDLEAAEQFRERHASISPTLTKWMKRVRMVAATDHRQSARKADNCPASRGSRCACHPLADFSVPFKYCLVAEAHKSGLPHYHLLISESDDAKPLRARHIKGSWRSGFSDVKLVAQEDRARTVGYVCKYLSKSALARVRASVGYGHGSDPEPYTPERDSIF
jgi:hypothetical protein